MKYLILLLICVIQTSLQSKELVLADLKYYTESFPPYNFKENGQAKGIAVDLLIAATADLTQPVKSSSVKVVPWPRGYLSLTQGPNVVLFSTTKTEKRKPLFKWAGPIAETRHVLLAKKSRSLTVDCFKSSFKYKVGAIKDDAAAQLLIAKGFDAAKIDYGAHGHALAKQLKYDRIDIWAYDEGVARWFLSQNGMNNDDYEAVYTLSVADMYFAFSKDVPDHLVDQMQQKIDSIRSTSDAQKKSQYDEILEKYY